MKIPIRNVYYLLCYAWDTLDGRDAVDVHVEDEGPVAELCARVLLAGFKHEIRRGLDRQYHAVSQRVPGIRGKLELSDTIKSNLLVCGQSSCRFDEFTYDIRHNRIIKATLRKLALLPELDRDLRDELAGACRRLRDVSDIVLRARDFREVQFHRNNRTYVLLVHVCRLVFENLLVEETTGTHRFRDIVRDDRQMARLFQRFVLNFFKREQSEYRVSSPRIQWRSVTAGATEIRRLPIMQTDVVLYSHARTIILDTKFYRQAFVGRFGAKLHSGHLYQMMNYLQHWPRRNEDGHPLTGVLVYPVVSEEFSLDYEIGPHRLRAISIDLRRSWQQIHSSLLSAIRFDTAN